MGTPAPGPLPLALTMGDPAGIGLEIALKAWLARRERTIPPFVFLADPDAVTARARLLGLAHRIAIAEQADDAATMFPEALPVMPVPLTGPALPGQPDTAHAPAVISALEKAVALTVAGQAAGVATCPIAKVTLKAAGFGYPGHTEFLAALARRHDPGRAFRPVMMLAADELRVVPLTIHIPLAEVARAISRELIVETARITVEALRRDFGYERPRIAICGLNPHAGESGTMGREEIETIAPAIRALAAEGVSVAGPLPADTMFHAEARRRYDAAIAMYHDQALIPIKTLAFDRGVNVTLGLPFVRTSPDHGTAFDIAAKGVANPESLIQALLMAQRMAKSRAAAGGTKA